jgi:hypothetical protein
MASIRARIKPAGGFSHIVHILLLALLPALVFVFVRLHFFGLAAALILLAKWRMLAVKPRHWFANILANAVDIIVGLSLLVFMIQASSQLVQFIWAVVYGMWLILLKPRSDQFSVAAQAWAAQTVCLSALFLYFGDRPLYVLVILGWACCYMAARHFFTAFDEPLSRYLAGSWGYFAAALIWLLGHWLMFYTSITQPTLILSAAGLGLAGIYYLEKSDRLTKLIRREVLFMVAAVVVGMCVSLVWQTYRLRSQL